MSTATGTSSAAGATNTCLSPNFYDIPINDTACGVPAGGNHTEVMSKCCKGADVVSYNGDCGLYCLALDQTVDDITECLFANGIPWQDGFCSGTGNDTATATENSAPTATGASVVAAESGGAASKTGGDGASSSSAGGSEDSSAAAAVGGVSALGVTVSGLLLSSLVLGVFQL